MDISIRADVRKITEGFTAYQNNQVPYALSWTMARLGNQAKEAVVASMEQVFDQPTSFTLKGVRVAWISRDKNNLVFRVFINDWAGKGTAPNRYLYPEVEGGQRNETRFERALRFAGRLPSGMAAVPAQGAPMGAGGNVRNGFHSTVLSMLKASTDPMQNETETSSKRRGRGYKGKLFVGRPGGGRLPLGIYQRLGVRPLFIFVPRRPIYGKRLPFYELVQRIYEARFEPEFRKAFAEAMRTAR